MMMVQTRLIANNGLRMRIAEAGKAGDPLVILAHGWPESWYSWRHQIDALAGAGFHVIAPDMRGYGVAADMAGIVDEAGADQAVIVGHDWGSLVAWHAALLYPDRFRAVAALSVPYFGRPREAPTQIWKQRHGDRFYYILYHQEPGVAEAEYDANPEGLLRMLFSSPDTPRHAPVITDQHKDAGGWIGRWGMPKALPQWLSDEDLEYYVGEFSRAGFRGGLNYYRNFDRNHELMENVDPVVKIAGRMQPGPACLPQRTVGPCCKRSPGAEPHPTGDGPIYSYLILHRALTPSFT
jgi:pimeloyl-ACP methyl ester carboxylesterase